MRAEQAGVRGAEDSRTLPPESRVIGADGADAADGADGADGADDSNQKGLVHSSELAL